MAPSNHVEIDGACHCGKISFTATIDPARVSVCHCTDCQTLTGSPFRVSAICEREAICIEGMPATYRKTGESGRARLMYFCSTCGTPLFASSADGAGEWIVRWGAIRQRDQLAPARQIWTRSAVPWICGIATLTDGGAP